MFSPAVTSLQAPLVVHSHLGWDWVWQRPQQFLSRLSRRRRVLFVDALQVLADIETPRYILQAVPEYPNLTLLQMQFPAARWGDGDWVDAQRTRLLQEALRGPLKNDFFAPLQWFYDPMAAPCFVGKIGERANIYDCMDELSGFKFAQPELVARERFLLTRADLVFTGGRALWRSKSRFNSNCYFYGCGVDLDHFAGAQQHATPADLQEIAGPVLGYFGVIDERLDYQLIERLADANADWHLVFVGPTAKVAPEELPQRPNIHWLGRRDYAALPAYAGRFDVCLMPFALNEATEFINPTKALEYMATSTPIVSSAVPDVVANFASAVNIAHSHHEFIQACRDALTPDAARIAAGLQQARSNSWEAIVAQLESHLDELTPSQQLSERSAPSLLAHQQVAHKIAEAA